MMWLWAFTHSSGLFSLTCRLLPAALLTLWLLLTPAFRRIVVTLKKARQREMSAAAAPPLEDENLLSEILLRLPALPSTLPRASLVCKRWRLLVSDPGFIRRFREHHRHSPPLLGYFIHDNRGISYEPTLDPPDRVPAERFSLRLDHSYGFSLLGCQHGLVLISHDLPRQILVWDPVTGDQHRIAFPPWFDGIKNQIHGGVLRAAGEANHFQVVLVQATIWDKHHLQVLACVYSSETGGWGDLILTPIPAPAYCTGSSAVLVGNSLYWRLAGCFCALLEFDLERQSLAVIRVPVGEENKEMWWCAIGYNYHCEFATHSFSLLSHVHALGKLQ